MQEELGKNLKKIFVKAGQAPISLLNIKQTVQAKFSHFWETEVCLMQGAKPDAALGDAGRTTCQVIDGIFKAAILNEFGIKSARGPPGKDAQGKTVGGWGFVGLALKS